jgi:hypothetical protein
LIEGKTERHQFEAIHMIEAELQVLLNTLTEHDFQEAFRNWLKHW